ncbi:MAG: hypothetical protein ACPG4K_04895 [Haloferula sp.]
MIPRRRFTQLFAGLALAPAAAIHAGSPRRAIAPLHPVEQSDHPIARQLLDAAEHKLSIPIYYLGGSNPGMLRRFRPHSLYRLSPGGPIYTAGECLLRGSTRILRLDRVRLA